MQFYEVIENRTSIKKFKENELNKDKITRMINAAMMSPSWKNSSSYKFILVEDQHKKDRIAEAINNKTNEAAQSVREAPMVAVVVSDPENSGVVDGKELYLVDGAIAMEHFILAATAEGYGTCWIAALDEDRVRNALQIPDNFRVIGITPVGEYEEKKEHYAKKDINDYVFLDSWNKSYSESDKVLH